jgi:hypothetical protein
MKKKTSEESKSNLIAGEGRWFRFSSYEVVTRNGFPQYVRPSRGAHIELYKPFDQSTQILRDYLQLGNDLGTDARLVTKEEFDNERDKPTINDAEILDRLRKRDSRNASRIASFAAKWGLPGILWQCNPQVDYASDIEQVGAASPKFKPDYTRVFVEHSLWSMSLGGSHELPTGLLDAKTFLRYFLVDRFSISYALRFVPRFLGAYGEPIRAIVDDARDFVRIAESEATSEMTVANIALTLRSSKNGARLDYGFQSLISALRIMLALNFAAPAAGQIRLCAECRRPFTARNERGRYCEDSCSNRARQREWFKRHKVSKKKGKHHDGMLNSKKGR